MLLLDSSYALTIILCVIIMHYVSAAANLLLCTTLLSGNSIYNEILNIYKKE